MTIIGELYDRMCIEEVIQELECNITELEELMKGDQLKEPSYALRLQRLKERLDELVKKAEYPKG